MQRSKRTMCKIVLGPDYRVLWDIPAFTEHLCIEGDKELFGAEDTWGEEVATEAWTALAQCTARERMPSLLSVDIQLDTVFGELCDMWGPPPKGFQFAPNPTVRKACCDLKQYLDIDVLHGFANTTTLVFYTGREFHDFEHDDYTLCLRDVDHLEQFRALRHLYLEADLDHRDPDHLAVIKRLVALAGLRTLRFDSSLDEDGESIHALAPSSLNVRCIEYGWVDGFKKAPLL